MATVQDFFGSQLEPPPGIAAHGIEFSGLINLFNTILRIAIYASLLVALINLLVSAIQYIGSSGNPDILKQASSRIWISLLGLIVAAGSLVLAGLLGFILFGKATIFIKPIIYGPN